MTTESFAKTEALAKRRALFRIKRKKIFVPQKENDRGDGLKGKGGTRRGSAGNIPEEEKEGLCIFLVAKKRNGWASTG